MAARLITDRKKQREINSSPAGLQREIVVLLMLTPQIHTPGQVSQKFHQRFGEDCKVFRAPGRVNIIGEHTDYNQGFVLPAAIDFSCWIAVSPRSDKKISIYSENFA